MNEVIGELYRRAEREIRPEFLARLVAVLDEDAPHRGGAPLSSRSSVADHEGVVEIPIARGTDEPEVQRGRRGARRSWSSRAGWVLLAAVVLAVVIAATVPTGRGRGGRVQPASDAPLVSAGRPPCADSAAPLGVAPTRGVAIRVALMPDGSTFCLTDDETGGWLEQASLVGAAPVDGATIAAPAVIEQGVANDGAYYALLAIPESLPVVDVSAPGHQVTTFPSRIGRRLLVIDPDYDPSREIAHEEHQLSLRSASGTVVASVTLPRIARPAAAAGETSAAPGGTRAPSGEADG